MKNEFAFLTILMLAVEVFPQQANLELHVGDKVFTQDTVISAIPNCSLLVDCRIINNGTPADSLKLFYGVNAPNDIIAFPPNGGGFYYVPQAFDTVQQVVLQFRLFYGDTPLSKLQLSINVVQPLKVAARTSITATRAASANPSGYFDLRGRAINAAMVQGTAQLVARRLAGGGQMIATRLVR